MITIRFAKQNPLDLIPLLCSRSLPSSVVFIFYTLKTISKKRPPLASHWLYNIQCIVQSVQWIHRTAFAVSAFLSSLNPTLCEHLCQQQNSLINYHSYFSLLVWSTSLWSSVSITMHIVARGLRAALIVSRIVGAQVPIAECPSLNTHRRMPITSLALGLEPPASQRQPLSQSSPQIYSHVFYVDYAL